MSFKANGIENFSADLNSLINIPDDVIGEMLSEGAQVIVDNVVQTGDAMGVKDTGQMLASIKVGKPTRSDGKMLVSISPTGARKSGKKTKANAQIAYVNNYGKKGQPARPFFTDGIAKSEDKAVLAAEKTYEDYLRRKNL